MKAKLEATDSDSRQHLEQQVTRLSSRMADYQSDSSTAAASLTLRIQALEDQNNKVKVLIGSTYLYLKQPKLNECSLELCLGLCIVFSLAVGPGVVIHPGDASSSPLP